VVVDIKNINTKKGSLWAGIHNKHLNALRIAYTFYKIKEIKKISNSNITYVFKDIPDGNYTVRVLHDENNNNKLDSNFFGVPTEGFGFSNNPEVTLSFPSFSETKFEVIEDINTTIFMSY
jgi:uncharacterized protein (DUF2141 family)